VRATKISTLLWIGLAGIPAGWLFGRLVKAATGALPSVPWVLAIVLVVMAVLLLLGARVARGWISERRYDGRVDALVIARLLALGKAGSVFGVIVAGVYAGIGGVVLNQLSGTVARDRALLAAAVAVAGVMVAIAGYRLELACRVPPDESDEGDQTELR
jgi:undecaprenyl pyrophosphate phosphatase UppP